MTDRVLAEYLDGKEQSYMTKETFEFLGGMAIGFVPVTTRSIEQYKRIFLFGEEIAVKHALVCNGAVLLEDGHVDAKWYEETKRIVHTEIRELSEIRKGLANYDIKEVEGLMFYFKAQQPEETARHLRGLYRGQRVFIGYDARKVYCIPSAINKGNAVKRYCERFGVRHSIASGDSDFDIPMLNSADIALAPDKLMGRIDGNVRKFSLGDAHIISDLLCRQISKITEEQNNNHELEKRVL